MSIRSLWLAALMYLLGAAAPAVLAQVPAAAISSPPHSYPLGVGDQIEVSLIGLPDSRARARIQEDGTIRLLFMPQDFAAAGSTPDELARRIEDSLRTMGIYRDPVAHVDVVTNLSNYVTVTGAARTGGVVPLDRVYRLSDFVAQVGPTEGAGFVLLSVPGQAEQRLSVDALARGEIADPVLVPGSRLHILPAEFFIYGQVNTPGGYPLMGEPTVRKALARGGGLGPLGTQRRVRIYRNGQELRVSDLESEVRPGDVIHVGERLF